MVLIVKHTTECLSGTLLQIKDDSAKSPPFYICPFQKHERRLKVVTEEEKKEVVYEALHISLVSSDESDAEEDALKPKPLTWRTEEVTDFFKCLDERWKAGLSSQQKRQCVNRRLGLPSERTTHGVPQHLLWAVRAV